ncbi:MAG: dihydrodipicolinate synthase family protein [Oscillospiraceae bacterium]|nr:dihydrodipicolinate synthase family protein [Oscillospiraceae bacterium]
MEKVIANGVWPTMITPFTDDNKIDYGAVEELLDWYAQRGVTGVFAICQSSEIFFLSPEEKLSLLQFIRGHLPAGLELIASGHTADRLEDQIEEAKRYVDVGVDAYVFISNRLAGPDESDAVFLRNLETAVRALPDGTRYGFYECPYPYKRLLTPEVIREIASWGIFGFLKDTCCDAQQMKAKLEAMQGTSMKLFNANSATLLETLRFGAAGFSGVMCNFHPELYVWLCRHFAEDPAMAERVQDILGFFSVAECQNYPVNAKYYLGLEGLHMGIQTRSKNPADFTRNRQLEIEQMYRLTQYLKGQLGLDWGA